MIKTENHRKRHANTASTEASSAYVFDTQAWPHVDLGSLQACVEEASRLGRHLFIWDRCGQASAYFAEFGVNMEFITDMVNVALAKKDEVNRVLDSGLERLS